MCYRINVIVLIAVGLTSPSYTRKLPFKPWNSSQNSVISGITFDLPDILSDENFYCHKKMSVDKMDWCPAARDVTRTLIGDGGVYSYIHVLPDGFLLNLSWFQKKSVGHNTNIWINTPPPPNYRSSYVPAGCSDSYENNFYPSDKSVSLRWTSTYPSFAFEELYASNLITLLLFYNVCHDNLANQLLIRVIFEKKLKIVVAYN